MTGIRTSVARKLRWIVALNVLALGGGLGSSASAWEEESWVRVVQVCACCPDGKAVVVPAGQKPECATHAKPQDAGAQPSREARCYALHLTAPGVGWKAGDTRNFVLRVTLGEGVDPAGTAGTRILVRDVTATMFRRGALWVCPMKCAESETSDRCPVCKMKMKRGEGWIPVGAPVAGLPLEPEAPAPPVAAREGQDPPPPVAAEPAEATVLRLTASAAGPIRVRLSARTGANEELTADIDLDVTE